MESITEHPCRTWAQVSRMARALGMLAIPASFLLAAGSGTWAASIPLRWDTSGSPGLAGYRVYSGTAAGSYSTARDAGNTNQYLLDGLGVCTRYYVAVKSYNDLGVESTTYSNEISGLPTPVIASIAPANAVQGQVVTLVLSGSNFDTGGEPGFSNPGITLLSSTVLSCNQVQATVSIGLAAVPGVFRVILTNPDGSIGWVDGAFEVLQSAPPSVQTTTPSDGASNIPVAVWPTVTFSRPMDRSTLTPLSLRLLGPGRVPVGQMPGSPSVDGTGRAATIVPEAALAPGTVYSIQVLSSLSGVLDSQGRPMTEDFEQLEGFTTAPPGDGRAKAESPYWYDDGDTVPSIYFLSSNDGPIGAYLAIYGDDFGALPGSVAFGTTQATVVSWTWRKIVVIVPQGASGPVSLRTLIGAATPPRPFTVGSGTVRHLDGTAPAGGDGTETRPWRLFAEADRGVAPGDFVIVHGGAYGTDGVQEAVFKATRSGTPADTITYFANPGETVYLDATTSTKQAIRVNGDYVTFAGFVAAGAKYQGIYLGGRGTRAVDNEVKDGVAASRKGQGINLNGEAAAALGNHVHDNHDDGLYGYANNIVLAYNYIKGNGLGASDDRGYGIRFVGSAARRGLGGVIVRNYIAASLRSGIAIGQLAIGADAYENIITGNGEHCIAVGADARDTSFRNNVCYLNSLGGAGGRFSEIDLYGWDGMVAVTFYNNAVTGVHPFSVNGFIDGTVNVDYNFYDDEAATWTWDAFSYGTLHDWQPATGLDAGSHAGEPGYVNPLLDNFMPGPGSPLIDAGLLSACAWFPLGRGCDIGAFELAVDGAVSTPGVDPG